ncbi:hypothetical protein D9619_000388 [Psilocybe cf. subviscida]|uniref:G domain-containing protein n=1 Tax=Psilocybe cf. subviscida TaxID=2480587 RepID=A0A8H5F3G7_9AGAR|nr:hypothetical protein D9619_000388 [Psilocybe cf. subviscida]
MSPSEVEYPGLVEAGNNEVSTLEHLSRPIILVLGETGAGKSTFICAAGPTGRAPNVGHTLQPGTTSVMGYEVERTPSLGRRVILVDTPGFNDPDRSDSQILKDIIIWLERVLRLNKNARLDGIIFLQDIHNRQISRVNADSVQMPPAVVLANVACHDTGPPNSHTSIDFGSTNQHLLAWSLIDKAVKPESSASLSSAIKQLKGIQKLGSRRTGLMRQILESFKGVLGIEI